MLNNPLLVAALLAERRADLERAATRSRKYPTNPRRTWFRRFDVAALRRSKPAPTPTEPGRDALDELRDLEIELAAMITESAVEADRDDLDNDPVLV
jgi:HAMP domain-containing protein